MLACRSTGAAVRDGTEMNGATAAVAATAWRNSLRVTAARAMHGSVARRSARCKRSWPLTARLRSAKLHALQHRVERWLQAVEVCLRRHENHEDQGAIAPRNRPQPVALPLRPPPG